MKREHDILRELRMLGVPARDLRVFVAATDRQQIADAVEDFEYHRGGRVNTLVTELVGCIMRRRPELWE